MEDAQDLFREATAATGDKAEELRSKGMVLLEAALERAHELQTVAVEKGKEAAQTTDEFVRENPWKAVAISAGIGLALGLLISRR
jgi:ElaB/YqjD/DUF883 family membrane-anchored ribosome-binding protein